VTEFQSALDALAADDLHGLPDGQVLDRVAVLVAARNRSDAELTRTVRHADVTSAVEQDGLRSVRSWLIGRVRLSPNDATRVVRSGRVLGHFPTLAAGLAAGAVTAAQVNVVAEKVGSAEVARAQEQGIDLAAFDRDWAAVAAESRHDALVLAVQAFEGGAGAAVRQPARRRQPAHAAHRQAARGGGHRPG